MTEITPWDLTPNPCSCTDPEHCEEWSLEKSGHCKCLQARIQTQWGTESKHANEWRNAFKHVTNFTSQTPNQHIPVWFLDLKGDTQAEHNYVLIPFS